MKKIIKIVSFMVIGVSLRTLDGIVISQEREDAFASGNQEIIKELPDTDSKPQFLYDVPLEQGTIPFLEETPYDLTKTVPEAVVIKVAQDEEEPEDEFYDAVEVQDEGMIHEDEQETAVPESLVSLEETVVRELLAPLKEAAENIQNAVAQLSDLLSQNAWDDKKSAELIKRYRFINESIDAFRLTYGQELDAVRESYRGVKSTDHIIDEYEKLYKEITFALRNVMGLVMDVEAVKDLFGAAQRDIRDERPFSSRIIKKLEGFAVWKVPNAPGLQQYANIKAQDLLAAIKRKDLYAVERLAPELSLRNSSPYSDEQRVGAAQEKVTNIEQKLAQNKEHLDNQVEAIEKVLKRSPLEQSDLQQLAEQYAVFQQLLLGKGLLLAALDGVLSDAGDFALNKEKERVEGSIKAVYAQYFQQLKQFERVGLQHIKTILDLEIAVNEQLKILAAQRKEEQKSLVWRMMKKWRTPFPSALLEKVSALLVWSSSSQDLQNFVRSRAQELINTIDAQQDDAAIKKMNELAQKFYEYESRISSVEELREFKEEVLSSYSATYGFRMALRDRMDDLIRRAGL